MQRTPRWSVAAFLAIAGASVLAIATNVAAKEPLDEPPPPPVTRSEANDAKPAPTISRALPSEANGARLAMPRGIPEQHRHWLGVWLVPAHPALRDHMNLGMWGW
jgi:hypothetical protein